MPLQFLPAAYPHLLTPETKRIIKRVDMNVDYEWLVRFQSPFSYFELRDPDTGVWHRTYHSASLINGAQTDFTVVPVNTDSILQGSHYQVRLNNVCSVHFQRLSDKTLMRFELHGQLIKAALVPRPEWDALCVKVVLP